MNSKGRVRENIRLNKEYSGMEFWGKLIAGVFKKVAVDCCALLFCI